MSNNNFPTFEEWKVYNMPRLISKDHNSSVHDLEKYLSKYEGFSYKTFGTGLRTIGITEHIKKEINEILADPTDGEEWIDIVTLAFDGARRTGMKPIDICALLVYKMEKNMARKWPPISGEDKVMEHVRD